MLSQIIEFVAVLGIGILCGAMIYESVIEIGVRKDTTPNQKLDNWHLCFPAASGLFKPFGIALVPIAIAAGTLSGDYIWYVVSVTIFLLLPFTNIAIAPTNTRLLAMTSNTPDHEIEVAINTWDSRHHVRTIIIAAAFLMALSIVMFG